MAFVNRKFKPPFSLTATILPNRRRGNRAVFSFDDLVSLRVHTDDKGTTSRRISAWNV
jgi:hypothetical protein